MTAKEKAELLNLKANCQKIGISITDYALFKVCKKTEELSIEATEILGGGIQVLDALVKEQLPYYVHVAVENIMKGKTVEDETVEEDEVKADDL